MAESPEQKLLTFLKTKAEGATSGALKKAFGDEFKTIVPHIQVLINKGSIELLKTSSGVLFKAVAEGDRKTKLAKFKGLKDIEVLVFQIISKAQDRGIWVRDLKFKAQLHHNQTALTKVLRTLQKRRLIKEIKPLGEPHKKIYMLYELEPARELRGGPWYTDGECDQTFIAMVCKYVKQEAKKKPRGITAAQMTVKLKSCGLIQNVELHPRDTMQILDLLCYDGVLTCPNTLVAAADAVTHKFYVIAKPVLNYNLLTSMPCGICPVFEQCTPGGVISPTTCPYMKDWLDF